MCQIWFKLKHIYANEGQKVQKHTKKPNKQKDFSSNNFMIQALKG